MLHTNIVRRYGSAAARTSGDACTSSSSEGDSTHPIGASTPSAEHDRRQERLVDDAVDLVGIVGAGEARDEHAHAGEERRDEDDDDEEDLPADADRGVAGEADVVADHHVIDDALEAADHVLDHRRPGQAPHGARDRPLDDRAIERRRGRRGFGMNEVRDRRIRDGGRGAGDGGFEAMKRLYQAGLSSWLTAIFPFPAASGPRAFLSSVICHLSSVICHPSSAIHHPTIHHPTIHPYPNVSQSCGLPLSKSPLEPGDALFGGAVREFLRHHAAGGELLQAIVADGRGGVQRLPRRLRDRARPRLCAARPGLGGLVTPDAGIAVGLQLEAHRQLVRAAGIRLLLPDAPAIPSRSAVWTW